MKKLFILYRLVIFPLNGIKKISHNTNFLYFFYVELHLHRFWLQIW